MGRGIAEVCARSGYPTMVVDVTQQLVDNGFEYINRSLSVGVKRGKMSEEDKNAAIGCLKGTVNINDLADCDLVIEAAIENLDEKKKVFASLDKMCPPHVILASNTSCLSVLDMAIATGRPTQVLGMHFFNPVPMMKLVEIVRTIVTSDETIETAIAFGQSVDKTVVHAQDTPGFIVNRLLMPYLMNAIRMFEQGVATKEDIDQGMVLGCNHPMGPLTLLDLVGIDTAYYVSLAMYDEFKDPLCAPPTLLKKMVTAGHLGRKSGKGFYDYNK